MKRRIVAAVLALSALLTACSGGTRSYVPGSNGGGAASPPAKVRVLTRHFIHDAHHRRGRLEFKILIPRPMHRGARQPQFISPSTKGMTIHFKSGPTPLKVTVGLTPSSPGCSYTLQGTVCEFTETLLAGNYDGDISTYDAVNCGSRTCTIPNSANELSTAQSVAIDVVPGLINQFNVTLAGIPAVVALIPQTPMSLPDSYLGAGGIDLVGLGKFPFLVEALDADANPIVGPGSPTIAVGTQSGVVTATGPTATSPNSMTLHAPSYSLATDTTTVNFSLSYPAGVTNACVYSSAVCSASETVKLVQMLLVASSAQKLVTAYRPGYTTPVLILNLPAAIDGIGTDGSGDIVVLDNLPEIKVFPSGSTTPSQIYTTGLGTNPCCLVVDPGGPSIWAATGSSPFDVVQYVGSQSTPSVTIDAGNQVTALFLDSAKNIVISNTTGGPLGFVFYYPPPYTAGQTIAGGGPCSGGSLPAFSFAQDSSGHVFSATSGTICKYPPGFSSSGNTFSTTTVRSPSSIAVDASGNVWGTNTGPAQAIIWSNSSTSLLPIVPTPTSVALDANGSAYFSTGPAASVVELFSNDELNMTYPQFAGSTTSEVIVAP